MDVQIGDEWMGREREGWDRWMVGRREDGWVERWMDEEVDE